MDLTENADTFFFSFFFRLKLYCNRSQKKACNIKKFFWFNLFSLQKTEQIEVHESLHDRILASRNIQDHTHFPVFVDNMENSTSRSYGAFPIRLYAIAPNHCIAYQSSVGPRGCDVEKLFAILRTDQQDRKSTCL